MKCICADGRALHIQMVRGLGASRLLIADQNVEISLDGCLALAAFRP